MWNHAIFSTTGTGKCQSNPAIICPFADKSHCHKETTVKFIPTPLPGVLLIEPKIFQDERGFFLESYQKKHFSEAGIPFDFVQDNHSKSCQGVLRGMHYQIKQPQGKLLRVVVGEIYDVALDLRKNSPSFGKWFGTYLSAESKQMLWVPPGFAHGFYVTSPQAELLYKATDYYAPQWERTILWNDPGVNIEWPVKDGLPILSPKDEAGISFVAAEVYEDLQP
jgi:dTDP-4-dehydrorhamnose 3,5-epimerase